MKSRQQHTEQMLQQNSGALQQSQQQQAAAATVAGHCASSMSMVDTRLLGKPERWNGEDKSWKDWRFVTRAHLMAALPSIHDLLERAGERATRYAVPSSLKTKPDTVDNCFTCWFFWSLDANWRKVKVQVKEKVQLLGELCTNNGNFPRSRSRFAGVLISILNYRFTGDAHAAMEAFERCGHPPYPCPRDSRRMLRFHGQEHRRP